MKSCAAAAPIVGAKHATPAAHDYTATRPRKKEMATEIGAAAAVAPKIPGSEAASGGQVELTKPANWNSMSQRPKKKLEDEASKSRWKFVVLSR
jgi:hypothetical protein